MLQLYGETQITPPVGEPVSLARAKSQCHVTDNTQDLDILDLITTARTECEAIINRQFLTATYLMTLDGFTTPYWRYGGSYGGDWLHGASYLWMDRSIGLPRAPLQSVNSVQYYDMTGTLVTWDSSQYIVDVTREPGRLSPAFGIAWPIAQQRIGAVQIQFTCGYGAASAVPPTIKHAIRMIVGHWFENREDTTAQTITNIPNGARDLLLSASWGWYR